MEENQKEEKNTGMAIIAYILFFVPLLTESKNDPFVKYHVKQGLVLFIVAIIVSMIDRLLFFIPTIGWGLVYLLGFFMLGLLITGIMHAARGEQKPLPLIGKFAEKFSF